MGNIIITFIINILIIIFIINFGKRLRRTVTEIKILNLESIGLDFIVGLTLIISILFFLDKFLGFKNASYISLALLVLNKFNLSIFRIKKLCLATLIIFIILCFFNFQNSDPTFSALTNPNGTHNLVAHSIRAGNLSIYINENNYIPSINQNLFQSIAGSFLLSFSTLPSIQFNLALLMAAMPISTLCILSLILKMLKIKKHRMHATICFFLNTTLSTYLVTINDGGSSISNTRSIDVFLAICIFFIFLIMYKYKIYKNHSNKFAFIILNSSLIFSLAISGPQFLMFIIVLFVNFIIISLFYTKHVPSIYFLKKWIFYSIPIIILPFFLGGFFILESFRDLAPIPAIGGLWDDPMHAHRRIGLRFPFVMSYSENGSHLLSNFLGQPNRILEWPQIQLQYGIHLLTNMEKVILSLCTFRHIIIPFAGILSPLVMIYHFRTRYSKLVQIQYLSVLVTSILVFLFAISVEIQAYTWPVTRFMHPAIIIGSISFTFILSYYSEKNNSFFRNILIKLLIFTLISPGIIHLSNQSFTSGLKEPLIIRNQFLQNSMTK